MTLDPPGKTSQLPNPKSPSVHHRPRFFLHVHGFFFFFSTKPLDPSVENIRMRDFWIHWANSQLPHPPAPNPLVHDHVDQLLVAAVLQLDPVPVIAPGLVVGPLAHPDRAEPGVGKPRRPIRWRFVEDVAEEGFQDRHAAADQTRVDFDGAVQVEKREDQCWKVWVGGGGGGGKKAESLR